MKNLLIFRKLDCFDIEPIFIGYSFVPQFRRKLVKAITISKIMNIK